MGPSQTWVVPGVTPAPSPTQEVQEVHQRVQEAGELQPLPLVLPHPHLPAGPELHPHLRKIGRLRQPVSAAEDDGPAGVGAGGRRLTAPGTRRPSPGSEPRGLGGEMLPRGGRRFVTRKRWAVRADAVRGESRHGPRLGRSCSLSLRSRHLILINCEGGSFLSTGVPFDLPSTCLWRPAETPWLLPGLSCVTGTSVTCEGPSGAVRMEPPAARRLVEDGNPKMVPVFVLMQGRVWWMACGRGRPMP